MTASKQDCSINQTSSMLHPFLISSQSNFGNQNVNLYGRPSPCLGLLPGFHRPNDRMSTSFHAVQGTSLAESEIGQQNHNPLGNERDSTHQAHSLSLSLGSHILAPQGQFRSRPFNSSFIGNSFIVVGEGGRESPNTRVEHINHDYSVGYGASGSSSCALSRSSTYCGTPPFPAVVGNSRYLKPVQCLLQDLVNVNINIDDNDNAVEMSNKKYGKLLRRVHGGRGASGTLSSELKADLYNNGILPAEKNELQFKIAKLIALLEEVENRCEKYSHHMEALVSSFEELVGAGSAKLYTAQPLQAMTRHFCFLAEEIVSHIYAIRRRLSRELRGTRENRLRLQHVVYYQSQRHAWRPIRGLPESSVAVLRSWLFEHFLHPYPNDPEKLMLASQTGLTKNQVSNWFINARVRLWKPMIEDMYKEELADSPDESNSFDNASMGREDA